MAVIIGGPVGTVSLTAAQSFTARQSFNAPSAGDDTAIVGVAGDVTGAVGDLSGRGGIYTRWSGTTAFHGGRNDPTLGSTVARSPGNTSATQFSARRLSGGGDTAYGFIDRGSVSWDVVQGVLGPCNVKVLDITGSPTGGTFTLTYNGQTTTAINAAPFASDIQTALTALSSIGAGKALVTGSGTEFTITLDTSLIPTAEITANSAALTGGTTPKVVVGTYAEMGGMLPQITNYRFGALVEAVEATITANVQGKTSVVTAILVDNAGVNNLDWFNFTRGFWAHAAGSQTSGDAYFADSGGNGWTNFARYLNNAGAQVFRMDNTGKMEIGANKRTLYDAGGGLTIDGLLVVGSFQTTGSMKTNGIVLASAPSSLFGWSSGNPNGVTTASKGSMLLGTDGTYWIKTSNSSNTGWVQFGYTKTGTATLAGGTVTVADTSITANSVIRLTNKTIGGTPGALYVSAKSAGASFTITSTSGTDTSTVQYDIVNY